MATGGLRRVLEQLDALLAAPDGQLLSRFVAGRDEESFAALVRRHGPMVLGVCRRVLRHEQDAEDAFQATFLVLARKAGSVVRQGSLGGWLHRVAHRTALEARAAAQRRRGRERQAVNMPQAAVGAEEPQDWRPLLDQELDRLPDKYRAAVVLCDLEGRPRREAARVLNLPEGTLSSRLAAARRMLAGRLARRGLAVSGGALGTALAAEAAPAAVPGPLAAATSKAATLVAAGELPAVPASVAGLMRGVLKAMLMTKLKFAVGGLVAVAALTAGGLAYHSGPAPAAAQTPRDDVRRDEARPPSEIEALRKENELLRLNLQVLLEKVRAQEAELQALRSQHPQRATPPRENTPLHKPPDNTRPVPDPNRPLDALPGRPPGSGPPGKFPPDGDGLDPKARPPADPAAQAEAALKELREARDEAAREQALRNLEDALRKLRQQTPSGPERPAAP